MAGGRRQDRPSKMQLRNRPSVSFFVVFVFCSLLRVSGLAPPVLERLTVRSGSQLLVAEGKAESIDSGARIWDSGREMSAQLLQQGDALAGKRVLELGAGTGIGGLSAAACGADVLLSDQAHMLPLLTQNIATNGLQRRAVATQLLWGDLSDIERVAGATDANSNPCLRQTVSLTACLRALAASGPFDLVMGSDLLYAPHIFPLLLETLEHFCTPGQTEVLLTYPTRYTEDLFFSDAELHHGFEVDCAEEVGCNVWATRMRRVC